MKRNIISSRLSSQASFQVKADGFRTRTYSYSNLGFDGAVSYACYLIEAENAENVVLVEKKPNGDIVEERDPEVILSMM